MKATDPTGLDYNGMPSGVQASLEANGTLSANTAPTNFSSSGATAAGNGMSTEVENLMARSALKNAIDAAIYDPNNQKDKNGQTHCNNVPPQVLAALGIYAGDLQNKDSKGNLQATKATQQLSNLSKSFNWHSVIGEVAQALANIGVPVVVGAPGHIGVVYPGIFSTTKGPQIGQAGDTSGVFSESGSGFASNPTYYAPNNLR